MVGVDNWAIFGGLHKLSKLIECKTKIILGWLDISTETPNTLVGLIEDFSQNSVNISDCRALSLFQTVTGSRIKTIVILWYAHACRILPLLIHNNFYDRLAIPNKHRIFSLGSQEAFCNNSLNISNCRCKRKFSKCQAHADFIVCTSSVISSSCTLHNFWNHLHF